MPGKTRPDSTVQPEPGDNTKYLMHNMTMMQWKRPDMSNAEEVEQRVFDYFNLCAQNDMKPSVAGLALAFGVSRVTIWRWANKQQDDLIGRIISSDSCNALKRAYILLNAQMEDYMQNGRINPVAGIFMMKNHFGYEDKTEVVVQPGKYDALPDGDKLAQEYIDAVTDQPLQLTEAESAESTD